MKTRTSFEMGIIEEAELIILLPSCSKIAVIFRVNVAMWKRGPSSADGGIDLYAREYSMKEEQGEKLPRHAI